MLASYSYAYGCAPTRNSTTAAGQLHLTSLAQSFLSPDVGDPVRQPLKTAESASPPAPEPMLPATEPPAANLDVHNLQLGEYRPGIDKQILRLYIGEHAALCFCDQGADAGMITQAAAERLGLAVTRCPFEVQLTLDDDSKASTMITHWTHTDLGAASPATRVP